MNPTGQWELRYPEDWTVRQESPTEWVIHRTGPPDDTPEMEEGEIVASFIIRPNDHPDRPPSDEGFTFESLTAYYFDGELARSMPAEVISCGTVEINGIRWVFALFRTDLHGPGRSFGIATLFEGELFEAGVGAPDGPSQAAALELGRDMFHTFQLQ